VSASSAIRESAEVAAARRDRRPIVALESSVLAQGLPIPANVEADRRMRAAIVASGAVPAITAVNRGALSVGLEDADLQRFLKRDGVRKVSSRDLSAAMAAGVDGATTVAATLTICRAAGLSVFATGGIGGVHREPAFDESADLLELSRAPVVVVCAGAKSILDLPATLERLESFSVTVVGYGTDEFPGFFTRSTGLRVSARADSPRDIAEIARASWSSGHPGAVLVVQPVPESAALDARIVAEAVESALADTRTKGVRGAAITPHLLASVERATGGKSLAANLALLESNAALAGQIAVALAGAESS
jgi:pseudouridine-5'-phosphate glycosidase